jgi:ATP-binding cassette subfamily C protein/ATP-binding cassette subfamily C protein LapB
MVEALSWRGDARQLFEALPHFVDDLDVEGFRNALANLGYASHSIRVRQDRIDPALLPCLFVPDRGAVRVLLAPDGPGLRIFDGYLRRTRSIPRRPLTGTAYIVAQAPGGEDMQTQAGSWLGAVTQRFRRLIRRLLAVTLLVNLLSLATPLFIMSVYDLVIPTQSVSQLFYLLAGVGIAMACELMFRTLRARTIAFVAGRIDNIVGNVTFRQLLFLPASLTESAPIGSQVSRLKEFESVREFFTSPIAEAVLDMPFVPVFLGVIAILGGPLVFVPVTVGVLFVLIAALLAPRLTHATEISVRSRSRFQRFAIEAISQMRVLKYTGLASRWLERFREASAESAHADFGVAVVNHLAQSAAQALMLGAGIGVLGFGAMRVMDGDMSMGALVAIMVLGWRVLSPLQAGFVAFNRIEQIRSSIRQIGQLVRLPVERTRVSGGSLRPIEGGIAFSWVSHRYSAEADPVLFGVSFEIAPREVVAVTGPNGSGKSTIIKLLTGLYRPQAGSVLIDGLDVRQMDPVTLRQRIAVVPQNSHLFYGTIAQNLRLGAPTAVRRDLVAAARDAKVYDDIMALEEGFETRLTERVMGEMPTGFKQKLALARAYLRHAPIMIFDEATQTLDEDGDKAFLAAIQRMRGTTTIVIVTHRPSHMRIADRVILMNAGKIAMIGTPDEVLKRATGTKR